ncbi:ATP-binding protein [Prevotella pectinovora]|uniref:ATP-binding protein n=1 Tax=Prevotella pectinovora TaxID=1602169 RepID=UPI0009E574AB|nr:AAA family ATPase [Prevotella pectinovora]
MQEYIQRNIDVELLEWKNNPMRKPLLLRGARQVGKSSAVRHFGKEFKYFAEVNFERHKAVKTFFQGDIDIRLIAQKIAKYINVPIEEGETLLFLDEIQECPEAIMALRFFKEDYPGLHVIAAGSLLGFTLQELPTYGVGRIHTLFMYPMTFDEFLKANDENGLIDMKGQADSRHPLDDAFHEKLVEYFRIYLLVGGMPEAVLAWIKTHDFNQCSRVQEDIILTYDDDFSKYKKRVSPDLLRTTMRGICHQSGEKIIFKQISADYRSSQIREAVRLLTLAGLTTPVVATSGNGIPLDAEANEKNMKILFLDSGLLLTVLQLEGNLAQHLIEQIMTGNPQELVNKGGLVEMVAGLEILRNKPCVQRQRMFYWEKSGNSIAEIDYLDIFNLKVTPIEIKSGTQGGMKSLWLFMREKNLTEAIRCSFENFGEFSYTDSQADNAVRHITIVPLYALENLQKMKYGKVWLQETFSNKNMLVDKDYSYK